MAKARDEFVSARNGRLAAREEATRRRQAAVKYSRLVTELVVPPGRRRASMRRDPSKDANRDGALASAADTRAGLWAASGRRREREARGLNSSAPGRLNEHQIKELSCRATALNKQARQIEDELHDLPAMEARHAD
mmetsp:Transcript_24368/g.72664  ORF Transcript_24368/g.72664 Transcript_24368/m.72664 type:complete len:136 (+) Transcript_24368:866-1273(+)